MTPTLGQSTWRSLLCFAVVSLPTLAWGQGNNFNPFGNSGYADYREFAIPTYNNSAALPGQARLQSLPLGETPRRSSPFEDSFDRFDDPNIFAPGASPRRGVASPGVPYYRSYRRYDDQYGRVYSANNSKADRDFAERMKQRERLYAEALKERDPTKRAGLLRQLNTKNSAATNPAASQRTTSGARPSAAAATRAGSRIPTPPAPGSTAAAASRDDFGPAPPLNRAGSSAPAAPRPKASKPRSASSPYPVRLAPG